MVGRGDLPDGRAVDGAAGAVDDDRAVELDDRRRRVGARSPAVGLERVAAVGDRREHRAHPGHEDAGQLVVRPLDLGGVEPRGVDGGVAELVARRQRPQEAGVGGEPEDRRSRRGPRPVLSGRPRASRRGRSPCRASGRTTCSRPARARARGRPARWSEEGRSPGACEADDPGHRTIEVRPAWGRKPPNESSAYTRASMACPVTVTSSWVIGSGSPSATRSWSSTRSSPVMASVTGCSTWRRVFISRK